MVIIHYIVYSTVNRIIRHGVGMGALKSRNDGFKFRNSFGIVIKCRPAQITVLGNAPHIAVGVCGGQSVPVIAKGM